jgi:hypothetical protein
MKLLCAAVLLMAVHAAAFPEPDVTELKISVEVGSRLFFCQPAEHACINEASTHCYLLLTLSRAAQAQRLLAASQGWRHHQSTLCGA